MGSAEETILECEECGVRSCLTCSTADHSPLPCKVLTTKVTVKARSVCFKMGQKWRLVLDLTYPYTSLMTGFSFNSTIEEQLGDVNIEDLWIPYFTVTTDISKSDMKIHDSGCLWRYVRSVSTTARRAS